MGLTENANMSAQHTGTASAFLIDSLISAEKPSLSLGVRAVGALLAGGQGDNMTALGWPGPLPRALETGLPQALHISCHLPTTQPYVSFTYQIFTKGPPGSYSNTRLEYQKGDDGAKLQTWFLGLCSSPSPRSRAFLPSVALVLPVHLTRPSMPAAILPPWSHLPKGSAQEQPGPSWDNQGLLGLRYRAP